MSRKFAHSTNVDWTHLLLYYQFSNVAAAVIFSRKNLKNGTDERVKLNKDQILLTMTIKDNLNKGYDDDDDDDDRL